MIFRFPDLYELFILTPLCEQGWCIEGFEKSL
jgi:hypothetical protein